MLLFCKNKQVLKCKKDMTKQQNFKKFGIISGILFISIVILSIYFLQNCQSFGNCGFISTQIIHFIFITIGAIGTTYCLLIVKGLDDKIDKDLIEDYKELTDFNKDNNNGAEKDKLLSF
jgi:hypothetical protein